ncbi:MAG: hypothetical protein SPI87_11845, partial [Anaerobutyricum sp.]|nr:hypothetical protein [Anaerobutyricum sp.]
MDIIYADGNLIDVGVISGDLDVAFGKDENDFCLSIDLSDHCCEAGYMIYINGTEYGGIIDSICPDTENNKLEYKGRSWHGIMESKVLEPDPGHDYLIVSGEANDILSDLIKRMGLSDLFYVSEELSEITISRYQFERYTKGYTGIRNMLKSVHAKLNMQFMDKMIILSASPLYDYSIDEEWDESQINFQIEKKYHPVNHLICLGSGDLKDRRVIHLFTDGNGGIQPYKTIEAPYDDTQYILNKSKQILTGKDEISEAYDYNNASDTNNYVLLTSMPSRWDEECEKYYLRSEDEKYSLVQKEELEQYELLSSQPSDWISAYGNYFEKNGDGYQSVNGVENSTYELTTVKPSDWDLNYSSAYYYYYSDGVTSEYKNAESISQERYNLQTSVPTDWGSNFKSYYICVPVYQYVYTRKTKQKDGTWKKETITKNKKVENKKTRTEILIFKKKEVARWEYTSVGGNKAPNWKANTYYTRETYSIPPVWEKEKYYKKIVVTVSPAFESGKYYQKIKSMVAPSWKSNTYYQLFIDHYADLVSKGIEKLNDYWNKDTLKSILGEEYEYDVGDIVGGYEKTT